MSLAEYQPESVEVKTGKNSKLTVYGLSLVDVSVLMREHFPDLSVLGDLMESSESIQLDELKPLVISLISNAPGLAANIIALGAKEPDQSDKVFEMPGPVQISLLMAILQLTFEEVGSVKKAWEGVAALLKQMNLTEKLKRVTTKAV